VPVGLVGGPGGGLPSVAAGGRACGSNRRLWNEPGSSGARRPAARRPPARPVAEPADLIEPTLDTGELEALMVAPAAVGRWGTTSVPAPRPAAELVSSPREF